MASLYVLLVNDEPKFLHTTEAVLQTAGYNVSAATKAFEAIPLDGAVSLKKVTRQAVRELEREVILRSLQANNWNRKQVARALSISYRTLLYKIRNAGIGSHLVSTPAAATPAEVPVPAIDVDQAA
jgi:DNA-binding NtrC family response regulator